MPLPPTTDDVKRLIEDGLLNVRKDIAAIKTKQTTLENKLAKVIKNTNAAAIAQLSKDFAAIKVQSDSIAQMIGAVDMNDISIVVDAKGNHVAFSIGEFDFNSSIKEV